MADSRIVDLLAGANKSDAKLVTIVEEVLSSLEVAGVRQRKNSRV